MNIKVDLSNYATKKDIKNVHTSRFALKTNLASLKLVAVPVDLSKLSDVIKNDVVKKVVYDKFIAKVNNTDTSRFVLKTKYQTYEGELEKNSRCD